MKALLAVFAAISALIAASTIYPQTLIVKGVSSDDNMLTLVSNNGYEYVYAVAENTPLNYSSGDLVSAIMFNPYTPDDPSDDQVMVIRASGFTVRFYADKSADEIMLMSTG